MARLIRWSAKFVARVVSWLGVPTLQNVWVSQEYFCDPHQSIELALIKEAAYRRIERIIWFSYYFALMYALFKTGRM